MTGKRIQVEKAYDEPFVIVPNADVIELMRRVKPTAVCVYLAILTHANRKAGNTAYPGTALIAKEANVSRRTVVSAVQELQEAGILTVTPRFNEKNGQITSLYRLHRIEPPCADSARPPVQNLQTPYANNDTTPVQNLHTNQMNTEPDEGEPKNTARAKPKRIDYSSEFEAFWRAYPSGHGVKKVAYDEWDRLAPDEEVIEEIIAGVAAWKACDRWQRGFVKDAERFLKNRMWESEPPRDAPQPSNVTKFTGNGHRPAGRRGYTSDEPLAMSREEANR